jgi:hypothetical protein
MRATTGREAEPALLDDLVGRDEERLWYGKPHCFGNSEIDAELEQVE